MTKHTVESKYKNPDKFIELLKRRIADANWHMDDATKSEELSRGSLVSNWSKETTGEQGCLSASMGAFNVGNTIIQIGEVTKVTVHKEAANTSSKVYYSLLETRKR